MLLGAMGGIQAMHHRSPTCDRQPRSFLLRARDFGDGKYLRAFFTNVIFLILMDSVIIFAQNKDVCGAA